MSYEINVKEYNELPLNQREQLQLIISFNAITGYEGTDLIMYYLDTVLPLSHNKKQRRYQRKQELKRLLKECITTSTANFYTGQ